MQVPATTAAATHWSAWPRALACAFPAACEADPSAAGCWSHLARISHDRRVSAVVALEALPLDLPDSPSIRL